MSKDKLTELSPVQSVLRLIREHYQERSNECAMKAESCRGSDEARMYHSKSDAFQEVVRLCLTLAAMAKE